MAKKKTGSAKKKKGIVINITPFSSLLWAAGFLFVLTWVFILGFFVGRGFLPEKVTAFSDMKTRVKRIQSMINRKQPIEESGKEKEEEDPKLAFYERLSSKKNEVKTPWKGQINGDTKKRRVPSLKGNIASPQDKPDTSSPKSIAEKDLAGSPSDLFYTVQLASLRDPNSAGVLVDRLNDKGYAVYYYEVKVEGRIYYRVRCGRYATKEEAEKDSRRLEKNEGIKGFVTTLD
jgi:cell division septation protein DedD